MVNCLKKSLATLLSLSFILFMTSSALIAAEITATVDRNPIAIGESFQLILNAQGSIDKAPDFSELQTKFRIINKSKQSSFDYSNGALTSTKNWILTLIQEEPGTYTIPAIKFGIDKSNPITISVVENTIKTDTHEKAKIYFELDVEPKSIYVQQQIIYTFKVFRRVNIINEGFSSLATENNQALITKIGKVTEKNVVINGVAHIVSEYQYAIFPQKSGILKILPLIYEAQFSSGGSRKRTFFNSFNPQTTTKRIKSNVIEIEVKGIPLEFTEKYPDAVWLPVDNLTISEAWSGNVDKFTSGEPMTRTISLTAQNLTVAQLPDIKMTTSKDIKIYPDVPSVVEQRNRKGLVAKKQFKIALLPTKVGQHRLAKIVIPWWNTRTNKMQEAKIESKAITVTAALNQTDDHQLNSNDDIVTQNSNSTVVAGEPEFKPEPIKLTQVSGGSSLFWIIASIIFAILWLITVYLLISLRKKLNTVSASEETKLDSKAVSTKELKLACLDNNAHACSQLFIQWANNKVKTDRFTNLSSLLPYADKNLAQAIRELEHCLYGGKSNDWSGARIWSAFDSNPPDFRASEQQNESLSSLPSLYAKYK